MQCRNAKDGTLVLLFYPGTAPGVMICESPSAAPEHFRLVKYLTIEIKVSKGTAGKGKVLRVRLPSLQPTPSELVFGYDPKTNKPQTPARSTAIAEYPWPESLGIRDDSGVFFSEGMRIEWLKGRPRWEWHSKKPSPFQLSIVKTAERPTAIELSLQGAALSSLCVEAVRIVSREGEIPKQLVKWQKNKALAEAKREEWRNKTTGEKDAKKKKQYEDNMKTCERGIAECETARVALETEKARLVADREAWVTKLDVLRKDVMGIGPIHIVDMWGTPVITCTTRFVCPGYDDKDPKTLAGAIDTLGGKN